MQVLQWEDVLNPEKRIEQPVAVSIGVFDGLHLGHQKLLDAVKAGQPGIGALVITFKNNPAVVFRADSFPGDINSWNQKLKNFQLYGIDLAVLIDFSLKFSKISGKEFWNILFNKFELRKIVVGENFYFGNQRDTNVHNLPQLIRDCDINVVSPVEDKGVVISSTKIRHWIKQGEIKKVNSLLFRKYALDLQGIKRDSVHNFILKKDINQILPETGSYLVAYQSGQNYMETSVVMDDKMIRFEEPGSVNIENIQELIFIEKRHERR